jgi:hypothetical protein
MTSKEYIDFIWKQKTVWTSHTVSKFRKSGGFSVELVEEAVLDTIIYFIKSIERYELNSEEEKLKRFEIFTEHDFNNYFYKSIANKTKTYLIKSYAGQNTMFGEDSFDLDVFEFMRDIEKEEAEEKKKDNALLLIKETLYNFKQERLITENDIEIFWKCNEANGKTKKEKEGNKDYICTKEEKVVYRNIVKLLKLKLN